MVVAESRYECPPEMSTTQTMKGRVSTGWSFLQDTNARHRPESVMVFDGPPQELASLVPDDESSEDPNKTVWTFNKNKSRPIWFTCSYSKTSFLFARALPLDVTQCKIFRSQAQNPSAIGLICK